MATFWKTIHTKPHHVPDIVPTKMEHDFEQSECKKGNLMLAVFFCTEVMTLETMRKKMLLIACLLLHE